MVAAWSRWRDRGVTRDVSARGPLQQRQLGGGSAAASEAAIRRQRGGSGVNRGPAAGAPKARWWRHSHSCGRCAPAPSVGGRGQLDLGDTAIVVARPSAMVTRRPQQRRGRGGAAASASARTCRRGRRSGRCEPHAVEQRRPQLEGGGSAAAEKTVAWQPEQLRPRPSHCGGSDLIAAARQCRRRCDVRGGVAAVGGRQWRRSCSFGGGVVAAGACQPG